MQMWLRNMAERPQALPGAGSPGSQGAKPTPALRQAQDHPSKEGSFSYPLLGGVPRQRRGGFPQSAGRVFLRAAGRFLRNTRGAAALESAIGAVVLVTTSVLAFDLYTRATATATGLNVAVTVAEYVSREAKPKASELAALAEFLHGKFFPQADAAFVVVAGQGSADPDQIWAEEWIKKDMFFGQNASTDLAECSQVARDGPPAALGLEAGEIVVVAEVCVKHGDGVSYYHHILPTRSDTVPAESS